MILIALFIGAVLVIAAIRGTQVDLGSALLKDVPGYAVWAAAILAIGAIGFVPQAKPVSRALLVLVVAVIILTQYQNILNGFQNAWKTAPGQASTASAPTSSTSGTASTASSEASAFSSGLHTANAPFDPFTALQEGTDVLGMLQGIG